MFKTEDFLEYCECKEGLNESKKWRKELIKEKTMYLN